MINDHIDLFIAGTETTSTSLVWTFLYLLHHPDVKQRLHNEIEEVNHISLFMALKQLVMGVYGCLNILVLVLFDLNVNLASFERKLLLYKES